MSTVAQAYKVIDAKALKALLDKKEKLQLWNVLTTQYYRQDANIPGSRWIPVDTLTGKLAAEFAPSKDELIVTYCGGFQCPSSKQAAEKLVSLGYTNVHAFEGGLEQWSDAGFPLVSL